MKWDQQVSEICFTSTTTIECSHCVVLFIPPTQTLEKWLEESAHRDDDAMILAKYSRIDEGKIKALNLKLEQLQESNVKKNRLLQTESTETMAAQVSGRNLGKEKCTVC